MVIAGNGVQMSGGWTDVDRGRWWVIRWVISVTGCSFPSPSSSPIRHQFIPNCPNRCARQWQSGELCTRSHCHVHPGHQLWVASATEGKSDYVSDYVGGHSAPGCVVIIPTGAHARADRQRCRCAIIWHMVIWCRSCDGVRGVW